MKSLASILALSALFTFSHNTYAYELSWVEVHPEDYIQEDVSARITIEVDGQSYSKNVIGSLFHRTRILNDQQEFESLQALENYVVNKYCDPSQVEVQERFISWIKSSSGVSHRRIDEYLRMRNPESINYIYYKARGDKKRINCN